MILWILAIGGLVFVIACVRWRHFIFRSLLVALTVTAGSGLWLALGRHNLYVAWAPFILAPVAVFAWWANRHLRRNRKAFEKAMRAEAGEMDRKTTPKILSVEMLDD